MTTELILFYIFGLLVAIALFLLALPEITKSSKKR